MKNTKIEWCDHTVNLWWGCAEISEACKNCYAHGIAKRFGKNCWGKSERMFRVDAAFAEIEKLNELARKRGGIETVFINSMSDFFDKKAAENLYIWAALNKGYFWSKCEDSKNLIFLILTKRANEMNRDISIYADEIPQNVHFGISAENQTRLDERMKALSDFKGKLFLSCEPLLEEIDITPYAGRLDWVICGGENAPLSKCRNFDSHWAHKLCSSCKEFQIPYFFKTAGKSFNCWTDKHRDALNLRQYPAWHGKGGAK